MKRKRWWLWVLTVWMALGNLTAPTWARGTGEDPAQPASREFPTGEFTAVEFDGRINFHIIPGEANHLTIRSNPALFDQLKVENWDGRLVIRTDTGLFGPRERGEVEVDLTARQLRLLDVRGESSGRLEGQSPDSFDLLIRSGSKVEADLRSKRLRVSLLWNCQLTLTGQVGFLQVEERNKSRLIAAALAVPLAQVDLAEGSSADLLLTDALTGSLRSASRVHLRYDPRFPAPSITGLEVKEGASCDLEPL